MVAAPGTRGKGRPDGNFPGRRGATGGMVHDGTRRYRCHGNAGQGPDAAQTVSARRGAGTDRDVVRLWRMSTFDIVVTNQAREENG